MKPSPFKLERYFAEYEFSVPHLLCCSDCESVSIQELLNLEPTAQDAFLGLHLGYTESLGGPALREAIAQLYSHNRAAHVLVHAGAEEAIFNFMHVMLDPGDHIIVHSPCYQSLADVARGIGADVTEWPADADRGWALSLDFLADHIRPNTRVVVVNFPHNPTGYLPDETFVQALSVLSDQHGFVVFSDEVYRGLEYDPAHRLPAFADINPRAVSLGVMSKTYGLAGLRIGWIATRNERVFARMAQFKDYTTICNSAPSEFLAALALRHRETLVARNLAIIQTNLDRLDAFFNAYPDGFAWQKPLAGPIAFPRYRGSSIDRFCRRLVEQAGVLLLPGTLYQQNLNCFRIGFGRQDMAAGLAKWDAFMQGNPDVAG